MAKGLLERFESKVMRDPNSGCWLWVGYVDPIGGYGQFNVGIPGDKKAHRWSYRLYVGEIPQGMDLDHKCRQRCCVNPGHLEPVTRKENLRRGIGQELAKRKAENRTHCKYGHPNTPENGRIRMYKNIRYFQCLVCLREWAQRKRAKLC